MKPEQAVSTGTTIFVCEFDGGVVMGADTRTSTGLGPSVLDDTYLLFSSTSKSFGK